MDSIAKAYESGATDFLTKPINWLLLKHRVRYILRSYQMYQMLQSNENRLRAVQKISKIGAWTYENQQIILSPGCNL